MSNPLAVQSAELQEQLIAWRRHMHAHPELSGQEQQTARFVADELRKLGYQPRERVGGGYGVIADLSADGRPPRIALRADMDALPIHEETGLPHASRNPGVMHACGHDAHTAMLLGAARLLAARRGELRRGVRLIFQPHEEVYPGGAPQMIADGALEGIESIFGIHIASQLAMGTIGSKPGPFMAAINQIDVTIRGRGGHAAMPEQCIDPVVVAAQIIVALQSVASRSIAMTDAAVVSVTKVEAGTADNIIPDFVRLGGTIRTFDERVRERVCQRVREIVLATAQAFNAKAEITLHPGYPVLVNDDAVTKRSFEIAGELGFSGERVQSLPLQGGGEDFAYYCQKIPGAFVFLGARNEQKNCVFPHHHPRFDIDEDALHWGAALYALTALKASNAEPAEEESPRPAPVRERPSRRDPMPDATAKQQSRASKSTQVAPMRDSSKRAGRTRGTESTRAMAATGAQECPRCAGKLRGAHCKLVCDNCGYREDCTDLFAQ